MKRIPCQMALGTYDTAAEAHAAADRFLETSNDVKAMPPDAPPRRKVFPGAITGKFHVWLDWLTAGCEDVDGPRLECDLPIAHVERGEPHGCRAERSALSTGRWITWPLVAPAPKDPLAGLGPALILLTILTERLPPPGKTRHGLLVIDGALAVSLSQDGRFFVFRLDGPGDLDKSPEAVADEILDLYRKARDREVAA